MEKSKGKGLGRICSQFSSSFFAKYFAGVGCFCCVTI